MVVRPRGCAVGQEFAMTSKLLYGFLCWVSHMRYGYVNPNFLECELVVGNGEQPMNDINISTGIKA